MNFPSFTKGMKIYFKITNGVNHYVDNLLTLRRNKIIIDLGDFDNWLKSQIGDYIVEEGLCKKEAIKKHYGTGASKFIQKTIW